VVDLVARVSLTSLSSEKFNANYYAFV